MDDSLSGTTKLGLLPAREQSFPIILLSMAAEAPARQRARDMGAAAFFREPVDGEALLDAIRWVIGEPTAENRPSEPHWTKSKQSQRTRQQ